MVEQGCSSGGRPSSCQCLHADGSPRVSSPQEDAFDSYETMSKEFKLVKAVINNLVKRDGTLIIIEEAESGAQRERVLAVNPNVVAAGDPAPQAARVGARKARRRVKVGPQLEAEKQDKVAARALRERKKRRLVADRARASKARRTTSCGLRQWCDHKTNGVECNRVFVGPNWQQALENHMETGVHNYGVNPLRPSKTRTDPHLAMTAKDRVILGASESTNTVHVVGRQQHDELLLEVPEYKLLDGTALHVAHTAMGFACKVKQTTRQKKYTTAQLDFLEHTYMAGVPSKGGHSESKYTGYRAAAEMKIHGTTEGQRTHPHLPYWEAPVPPRATFSVRTLLSQWDIRPWYSNAVNTFENAIKRQRRRAISEEEASADHPSDDDEPDGED